MGHRLDLGQARLIDPYQRSPIVGVLEQADDFLRRVAHPQASVDCGQDAASNRQQVRRKSKILLLECERLEHLRNVPVGEKPVSAAVLVHLSKV